MGLDDFVEAEVGLAVAATSALFSPRVRGVLRRGAVYGLAGALRAGDAVASTARGVASGVRGTQPEEKSARPTRTQARQQPAARGRGAARGAAARKTTPQAKPAEEAKPAAEAES